MRVVPSPLAFFGGLVLVVNAGCLSGNESDGVPFEAVSPSVVLIETTNGHGSGVVLDDAEHVVTNYHVIADGNVTAVILRDGTRLSNTSVAGFNRRADLAVLEVENLDAGVAPPLEFLPPDEVAIGDPVYAIGYPFQDDARSPVPQLTVGVVSAKRRGVLDNIDFIQADASFSPGLSGGALVDRDGRLIGVPTLTLPVFGGGLAISAHDVQRITTKLISSGGDKEPVEASGDTEIEANTADAFAYQVFLSENDELTVDLFSDDDLALSLRGPLDIELAFEDSEEARALETLHFTAPGSGAYTLVVETFADDADYNLVSSHLMSKFVDPEDTKEVAIGKTVIGELQHAGDKDTWELDLKPRDIVEMRLLSWHFDAFLTVIPPTAASDSEEDDNSGRGIVGSDAFLRFRAGDEGTYKVIVSAASGPSLFFSDSGFYRLEVEEGD